MVANRGSSIFLNDKGHGVRIGWLLSIPVRRFRGGGGSRDKVRLGLERAVVAGGHRGIGILQTMAGHGEDDPARTCLSKLEESGHGGRARWLYKNPFTLGKPALGGQNVCVGDDTDCAVTFLECGVCALPARRDCRCESRWRPCWAIR